MAGTRSISNCVNLRDVAIASMGLLKPGIIYRSSELYSAAALQTMQLKTIIDLRRRKEGPCGRDEQTHHEDPDKMPAENDHKKGASFWGWSSSKLPRSCAVCSRIVNKKFGLEVAVFHADLIQVSIGVTILLAMPWRVRLHALQAWALGQGPESVLTPAVADPLIFGYKKLYRTLLDQSQKGLAVAFRVMTDMGNFPLLIQCIHGKDRTGIVVMLLLLLCKVPHAQIVDDYVKSGTILKQSALMKELHLEEYLTSDQVLSAEAQTMEETIQYLERTWGSAEMYLQHKCGLSEEEIRKVKENIKVQ